MLWARPCDWVDKPKTYYDTVGSGGNRDRGNHTGSQAISTITGLQLSLDGKQPLNDNLTFLSNTTGYKWVPIGNSSHTYELRRLQIVDIVGLSEGLDAKQPLIAAGTTNQFLSWDKTMRAVDWSYIANKPSLFPPSAHDHEQLTGNNYISGGDEVPGFFGSGKLRLQMLANSPNGGSPWGWADCLWLSAYTGGDVKRSNMIVMSGERG